MFHRITPTYNLHYYQHHLHHNHHNHHYYNKKPRMIKFKFKLLKMNFVVVFQILELTI